MPPSKPHVYIIKETRHAWHTHTLISLLAAEHVNELHALMVAQACSLHVEYINKYIRNHPRPSHLHKTINKHIIFLSSAGAHFFNKICLVVFSCISYTYTDTILYKTIYRLIDFIHVQTCCTLRCIEFSRRNRNMCKSLLFIIIMYANAIRLIFKF